MAAVSAQVPIGDLSLDCSSGLLLRSIFEFHMTLVEYEVSFAALYANEIMGFALSHDPSCLPDHRHKRMLSDTRLDPRIDWRPDSRSRFVPCTLHEYGQPCDNRDTGSRFPAQGARFRSSPWRTPSRCAQPAHRWRSHLRQAPQPSWLWRLCIANTSLVFLPHVCRLRVIASLPQSD